MREVFEWTPDGRPVFREPSDAVSNTAGHKPLLMDDIRIPSTFYDQLIAKLKRGDVEMDDGNNSDSAIPSTELKPREDPLALAHQNLMRAWSELQLLQDICVHAIAGKGPDQLLPQHLTLHPSPLSGGQQHFPRGSAASGSGSGSGSVSRSDAATPTQIGHQTSQSSATTNSNQSLLLQSHRHTFTLAARRLRREADRLTDGLQSVEHPFFESLAPQLQQLGHPLHPNLRLPYFCSRQGIHSAQIDLRFAGKADDADAVSPVKIPDRHAGADTKQGFQCSLGNGGGDCASFPINLFPEDGERVKDDLVLAIHRQLVQAQHSAAQEALFNWLLMEMKELSGGNSPVDLQLSSSTTIKFQAPSTGQSITFSYGGSSDNNGNSSDAAGPHANEDAVNRNDCKTTSLADWLHWSAEQEYCRWQQITSRTALRTLLPLLPADERLSGDIDQRASVWESISDRLRLLDSVLEMERLLKQQQHQHQQTGSGFQLINRSITSSATFSWLLRRGEAVEYSIQLTRDSQFSLTITYGTSGETSTLTGLPGCLAVMELIQSTI